MLVGPYWNYSVLHFVWHLCNAEESKAGAGSGAFSCTAEAATTFWAGSFKGCWGVEDEDIVSTCVAWNTWVSLVILAPK